MFQHLVMNDIVLNSFAFRKSRIALYSLSSVFSQFHNT